MDLTGAGKLPFLSRRNYIYELQHMVLWSVLAGLIEGQFASVVISKTFHAGPLLIAIASATPVAALTFSLVWGMLCVGRPKIRLFVWFCSAAALCAGAIGAIPTTSAGAVWFLCQMAACQVLLAGVVTIRSAVWKSNYPHEVRGRITARLQAVRILCSNIVVLIAAGICDIDPTSYRYIFPVAAVFGLGSVLALRRIRIRGEGSELRRHREGDSNGDLRAGLVEPFNLTALLSPGHVISQMVRVLRDDRRFYHYCIAQMFSGISNLMTIAVVVTLVTQSLPFGDRWGFWISAGLIQSIQRLVMLGTIGRWARLFDRVGVVRFRVIHTVCWIASILLGLAATLTIARLDSHHPALLPLAVSLFAARGLVHGLGLGGAALAWNLGHLHFAKAQEAELYMGIHVSLTGFRGLLAPLFGMWLFQIIGWRVWLVALVLACISLSVFAWMARIERGEEAKVESTGGDS